MVALTLALSTTPCLADAGRVLDDWNLIGTWAADCSKPASPTNAFATYAQSGDGAFLQRDVGRHRDQFSIIDATTRPDGALAIVIDFGRAGKRTNVFVRDSEDRIRAITNHDSKGRHSVRNGVVLALKRPTPWQQRCAP